MPSIIDLAEISNAIYSSNAGTVPVEPLKATARIPVSLPGPAIRPAQSLLPQPNACMLNQASEGSTARVWKRVQFARNPVGFYAGLYVAGNQRVIAFRGTDDFFDGLIDDVAVAGRMMPPQVIAAFQVASVWGAGANTYVTGHSLGGALAILSACHFNLPAVTFNAPGVADACVQIASVTSPLGSLLAAVSRCVRNSRVRNIRITGDPVSSYFATGFQAGGNVTSYGGGACGFDMLCRHGMATCLSAVRSAAENYQDLTL